MVGVAEKVVAEKGLTFPSASGAPRTTPSHPSASGLLLVQPLTLCHPVAEAQAPCFAFWGPTPYVLSARGDSPAGT